MCILFSTFNIRTFEYKKDRFMFISTNFALSIVMVICALLGWGTQTNGLVNLNFPPSLYHFDFMIWRTIWCFVFCITLGTRFIPPNNDDYWQNIKDCFNSGVCILNIGVIFRQSLHLVILEERPLRVSLICFSSYFSFRVCLDRVYRALCLFKLERRLFLALFSR